jgi:hypothetical protein
MRRPDGIPETGTVDVVFGQHAKTHGVSSLSSRP